MSQNERWQFRHISLARCSRGWQFKWTIMPLELSYHTVWDWAWGQNMFPLLIDIAHATINREYIYSLLNNAAWPCNWISVSDWNSISLNDMVPSDTWFWLSYIIRYINVFKQYITSYLTKLTAGTRLVPSQTFPQLPVHKDEPQILSACATENCLQHHVM
jgi:hypothetical protein